MGFGVWGQRVSRIGELVKKTGFRVRVSGFRVVRRWRSSPVARSRFSGFRGLWPGSAKVRSFWETRVIWLTNSDYYIINSRLLVARKHRLRPSCVTWIPAYAGMAVWGVSFPSLCLRVSVWDGARVE
jgi:hypothetical protein